jgi:hypothetical protein
VATRFRGELCREVLHFLWFAVHRELGEANPAHPPVFLPSAAPHPRCPAPGLARAHSRLACIRVPAAHCCCPVAQQPDFRPC